MATYNGTTGADSYTGTSTADSIMGMAGNDTLNGGDGNDLIDGGTGNDSLIGGKGDDTVYGGGGADSISGWAGNDTLILYGGGGLMNISGDQGNDYLEGKKTGYGQFHLWGGEGNDRLVMDVANSAGWGWQGHHAYGGRGADRFEFKGVGTTTAGLMGRLDDFDASRDTIWVGSTQVNLLALPSNMRIVEYLGQQWLQIGNNVMYGLEGARLEDHVHSDGTVEGHEEVHFVPFPTDFAGLPTVTFIDQMNFVPYGAYQTVSGLNVIDSGAAVVNGTAGSDDIWTYDSTVTSTLTNGLGGNDVINANNGHDTVYGGEGNDLIAGGTDRDSIFGDNGNDILYGGSENDSLFGGNGNDTLNGGTGNDSMIGNAGDDLMNGGHGVDFMSGHGGNDRMFGNDGIDYMWGIDGNDSLNGGAGNDRMFGGAGRDTVTGGAGSDGFVFDTGSLMDWDLLTGTVNEKSLLLDLVSDFVIGQDKIDFKAMTTADAMSDFAMWQTTINGNVYFTLQLLATNERILVDVADTTTYAQIYSASNFLFS